MQDNSYYGFNIYFKRVMRIMDKLDSSASEVAGSGLNDRDSFTGRGGISSSPPQPYLLCGTPCLLPNGDHEMFPGLRGSKNVEA
jgi:hypothetical protein